MRWASALSGERAVHCVDDQGERDRAGVGRAEAFLGVGTGTADLGQQLGGGGCAASSATAAAVANAAARCLTVGDCWVSAALNGTSTSTIVLSPTFALPIC